MAKYTIIADIGKAILEVLRDKLVPDVIDKPETIGLCDPKERGGYIVGVHLYDIREDASNISKEPVKLDNGSTRDAPAMIEISYVISVNSKAELADKSADEAKIIGKIIQVFKDNAVIPARYIPDSADASVNNIPISMLPLNMEEKVKIWTMFGESYKVSVFYMVGPVAIDSAKVSKPKKRVQTVHLSSTQFSYEQYFERMQKGLEFATFLKDEDIDDEYTQHAQEMAEAAGGEEGEGDDDSGGDDFGGDDDSGGDDFGGDDDFGGEDDFGG